MKFLVQRILTGLEDRYEKEIESYKSLTNELQDDIQQYRNQLDDLTKVNQSEIDVRLST